MGSCISSHHTDLERGTKHEMSFGSKPQNFVIKSPVKTYFNHQGILMKCSPSPSPTTLRDSAGSKDETFFDTQAWLESDCEDDFLSVKGDFTPSRGNTPVHMGAPPQVKRGEWAPDLEPEQSLPPNKRKTLSDLFKESVEGARNVVGDQNVKPFLSRANTVHSCERTPPPYIDSKTGREKSVSSLQCCLTGLLTSRSYTGSKKHMAPVVLS